MSNERRSNNEITMPQPPEGFPFVVSPEDIPYTTAVAAYSWNSMMPERRARQEQADYLGEIYSVWSDYLHFATTDETRARLAAHVERYRERLRRHYLVLLAARSRVANPMVTGPTNFPVRRNAKRLATEDRRREEYLEWRKRARQAIARDMAPPPPSPSEQIAALEQQRDLMKSINAEYRKCKGDIDAMLLPPERLKESMKAARERDGYYQRTGKFSPFEGFQLTSINGKIERLRASVAREEQHARVVAALDVDNAESPEIVVGDMRIVDSVRDDRVQVFFPGKPDAAMRDRLKKSGFRWSPNAGAWQAYRTANTVRRVQQLFGVELVLVRSEA
jgi:hypothetical protein